MALYEDAEDTEEPEVPLEPLSGSRIVPTLELPAMDQVAMADQVIAVLASHPNLYQRYNQLVQTTSQELPPDFEDGADAAPAIRPLKSARLRELIQFFFRFSREGKYGNPVHADCPVWLPQAIEARDQWQHIEPLTGIVTWPAMRPDGTFIVRPGYDDRTGIIYRGDPIAVPECPSERAARSSAEALLALVAEFPFESDAHRSSWLAFPLTILTRYAVDCAPVWVFDAPTPGSGKTLLAEIGARIVSGRHLPRMSPSEDDEENRKRITAKAISGDAVCLIDNLVGTFGGPAFDAAVTAPYWNDRVLGSNREINEPLRIVWAVSGNNITIKGDMQRRALHCRIDPQCERAEERKFKRTQAELIEHINENRTTYLQHLIVMLKFGMASAPLAMKSWGSFDLWSRVVRQAIVCAGLPDPEITRERFRTASDVLREQRVMLLKEVRRIVVMQERPLLVREILGSLSEDGKEAAAELSKGKTKELTATKLAMVFRKIKDTTSDGYTLRGEPNNDHVMLWNVTIDETD